MDVIQKIESLGLVLPSIIEPTANYELFRQQGALLFMAGQTSFSTTGVEYKGLLHSDEDIPKGYAAARLCALNLLGALAIAVEGDFDRVKTCVKVNGYFLTTPEFLSSPAAMNGASDLLVEVWGDAGRHARTALGVAALPFGYTAEVEAVFELK